MEHDIISPKASEEEDLNDMNEQSSIADRSQPLDTAVLHAAHPSSQEVEHVKAQIIQQTESHYSLQARHDEQFENLDAQIKQKDKHLLELKAFIAPIRRLPLEVMTIVLSMLVLDEEGESPWRLMRVCRTWRAAVMLARQLWTSLLLCVPDWPNLWLAQRNDGRYKGYQVCYTKNHLLCALNRVGPTPLDIFVSFQCRMGYTSRAYNRIVELFEACKDAGVRPRVGTLVWETGYGFQWQFPMEAFSLWDISPLRELTTWDEALLQKCLASSHNLRKLDIPTSNLAMAQKALVLSQLERLCLQGSGDSSLFETLPECRSLTELELKVFVIDGDQELPSSLPILPRLHRLCMSGSCWLLPLVCINLTYLRIEPTRTMSIRGEVRLPCLKKLEYSYAAFASNSGLPYLDAPNLEVLDVTDSGTPANIAYLTLTKIWTGKPGDSNPGQKLDPMVLKIREASSHPKKLGRILSRLTNCVELHLDRVLASPEIFEVLCPASIKKKKRGEEPPFFALKSLSITFTYSRHNSVTRDDIVKAASAFVAKRRDMGNPIKQMTLKIAYKTSFQDLNMDLSA